MNATERQAQFIELLRSEFQVEDVPDNAPPIIASDDHFRLASILKERGYLLYDFVVVSHWLAVLAKKEGEEDQPERYEVATGLRTIGSGSHLACWRIVVPVGEKLESLVPLFPGADWQEREQFDLVGIVFDHHPDLRRLMMPGDWEGHPLRKDYAIETACPPWR